MFTTIRLSLTTAINTYVVTPIVSLYNWIKTKVMDLACSEDSSAVETVEETPVVEEEKPMLCLPYYPAVTGYQEPEAPVANLEELICEMQSDFDAMRKLKLTKSNWYKQAEKVNGKLAKLTVAIDAVVPEEHKIKSGTVTQFMQAALANVPAKMERHALYRLRIEALRAFLPTSPLQAGYVEHHIFMMTKVSNVLTKGLRR